MMICEECEYVFPEQECEYNITASEIKAKCPKCKSLNTTQAIQCVFCKQYHSIDDYAYVSGICEECAEKDFSIEKFSDYCKTMCSYDLEDFFIEKLYKAKLKTYGNDKLVNVLKDKFFNDYINADENTKLKMLKAAWAWVKTDISDYCKWRLDYEA